MYQAVDRANTAQADLISADDSPTDKARAPTVREVYRLLGEKPLVIMHDHDLWRLRLTTRTFEHRVSFLPSIHDRALCGTDTQSGSRSLKR